MIVNADSVRIGHYVFLGNELCQKIAPLIFQSIRTKTLYYDARLIPDYENMKHPEVMVQYIGRCKP